MAAVARRVYAMGCQALADRGRRGAGLGVLEVGVDSRRRRRDRQSEDVIEKPLPAQDRRRTVGVRRGSEQRALRQQSATLVVVRKRHTTEAAAGDSLNSVVLREALVDERIVRA